MYSVTPQHSWQPGDMLNHLVDTINHDKPKSTCIITVITCWYDFHHRAGYFHNVSGLNPRGKKVMPVFTKGHAAWLLGKKPFMLKDQMDQQCHPRVYKQMNLTLFQVRIIVSVLYSALTPFLNPMIYSLRNEELRESIRRTLSRFRPAAVLPTKKISTLSWTSVWHKSFLEMVIF